MEQKTNQSLFTITQSLNDIFDRIEDAGGEITPEIEQELEIKQDELESKCASYISAIRYMESNIEACKKEKQRIDSIKKRDENRIQTMKSNLKNAAIMFGNATKTGGYKLKAGLSSITVSRSTATVIDNDMIEFILSYLQEFVIEYFHTQSVEDYSNDSDIINKFTEKLNEYISENTPEGEEPISFSEDDLSYLTVRYTSSQMQFTEIIKNAPLMASLSCFGSIENETTATSMKEAIKDYGELPFAKRSEDFNIRIG